VVVDFGDLRAARLYTGRMNSCLKFSTGPEFVLPFRVDCKPGQSYTSPVPHTFPALRDGPLSQGKGPEPE
jgi:hypothetical protein